MRKEYFDELFKANKTIIVPGFGAFTKNNPNDNASFNSFLKFNDGLLAGFLSKKLGLSVGDAGKMLEENVKKIVQTMQTEGKVSIAGIGHFIKGKDGKFAFSHDSKAIESIPFNGDGKTESAVKENRVVHEIKKDKPKEEVKKQPEVKPVVTEVKKEEKKPVAEVKKEEPKKEEAKKEDPKNRFIKPKPEKKPKDPNAKKKKIPWVWIGVIVILGGAGTFAGLKWDMVKGWFAAAEKKQEKKEIAEEPEVEKVDSSKILAEVVPQDSTGMAGNNVSEEPIKEKPVKEKPIKEKPVKEKPIKEKPVKETPPAVTYGDFHVIVNCYQSEANANKMVSKLSEKGFSAQNLGNRGGFFMVSAGSASSMDEAKSILQKASTEFPKAWIYSGK
ncbi:MAG: SPOR domain-containing protein [Flavobacteriales bacterium]